MQYSEFKKEMRFIFIWSVFLDVLFYILSVLIIGLNYETALSLIAGNTVLFINLRLLYNSILKNTNGAQTGKNPMMKGYLFRSLIACIAIAAGFMLPFLNAVGIMIPLFYPKIIYTVHSIIVRR